MFLPARTTRIFGLILSLGLFPLLGGCATWLSGYYQAPDVQLLKVEVVEAKLLEQQFLLHFRIANPNASSLPIRGIHYTLYLNDINLASDEYENFFTVPAHGVKTLKIPLHTNLWRHIRDLIDMLEQPDQPIRYRLQGEVKTGLLFGHRVQLSRNGEIIPGDLIPE
jgi:LEA14-like dessication related protein